MTSRPVSPPQEQDEDSKDDGSNRKFTADNALIIIDAQNEFISANGNFPIAATCKPTLLKNLTTLIPRFHRAGGHIIWVRATYENRTEEPPCMAAQQKGDGIVGSSEWLTSATHVHQIPCCEAGTFGAEIYPEIFALSQPEDPVVTKTGYSAFNGTTVLRDILREKQVQKAYFCGVASGTCVFATVNDAVKLGEVQVHAVPDCMGYRRYNTHVEALRRMKDLNVSLIESDQIFSQL